MNLKKKLFMMLITLIATLGITIVNAATISDDGKYTLILTSNEEYVSIDGKSEKIIKFNVAEGETTVKLSELIKEIVPFNGKNEFAYWGSFTGEKVSDDIAITDFKWSSDLGGVSYTNSLTLYAIFSEKPLQGTGTYYLTLDSFAGKVNGESIIKLTSKSTEFKTVDLKKYIPEREGFTFNGWELDGKIVTSIDSSYFANRDCITVTATYTQNTFNGNGIVLKLNANGGKIDGKETNSYDYIGGNNSGTTMSLLPYIPVKNGYTFNGWNTKKDGSGKNYNYVYWRFWDIDEKTDKEFEKDTKIREENGYERYKNITLYAFWIKNNEVNEIKSDGEVKASIIFDKEISKDYVLDIKKIEVKKELADKNVKYVVDINVLENGQIVNINDVKMKIKVALPEDLKDYKKYEIVYILDNEIKETIPATIEDGNIVFETSNLSEYGIVATEKSLNTNVDNPETGDNIIFYIMTSIISIIGIVGFGLYGYKIK